VRSCTDDIFVSDDFEEQHQDCDEVEEVSNELENVHPLRVGPVL